MDSSKSLQTRISTVFIMQAVAIACATLLGIYATATVLEDVLIRRALKDEALHFANILESNPAASEPNTFNMQGYLTPNAAHQSTRHTQHAKKPVPDAFSRLAPGFHNLRLARGDRPLVYVSDIASGRLTLVFDQQNVGRLALLFGLVPLVLVLVFIYVASLVAYRLSKRAISPIVWLANEVKRWDPRTQSESLPAELSQQFEGETQILADALVSYSSRINELVERERTFTRDASHELRSPLTVIKLAVEMLLTDGAVDKFTERNLRRIDSASRDMEALIEAFLLLARDSGSGLEQEELSVRTIIQDEIESAQTLLREKNVQLELNCSSDLRITAPGKVIGVMVGNLIRNACRYTDQGHVRVSIENKTVSITDSGRGISAQDMQQIFQPFFRGQGAARGGHGVGLTIVRRLSDRFNWPVTLSSTLGVGTTARIEFPSSEIIALVD